MEGPPIRKGSLDGRIPFGLSATVVSMILVSIMRFPWYTTDRVWVPENGTPQLLQYVLYIVLAWNSYSTWWEPLSMLRKAVAYIRASTLLGLIELGSHQLCLLAMVILVSILVLNQLPPIGGELGVQILKLIGFPNDMNHKYHLTFHHIRSVQSDRQLSKPPYSQCLSPGVIA